MQEKRVPLPNNGRRYGNAETKDQKMHFYNLTAPNSTNSNQQETRTLRKPQSLNYHRPLKIKKQLKRNPKSTGKITTKNAKMYK